MGLRALRKAALGILTMFCGTVPSGFFSFANELPLPNEIFFELLNGR